MNMQIFKNKFFIICLCVALILCAVPSILYLMGFQSLSRDMVGILTTPFRFVGKTASNAFTGFTRYFNSVDALNAENEALKQENDKLKEELDRSNTALIENERLKEYLGMKAEFPSFTMEEGLVLSHSGENAITGFTLNRGSYHGIEVNMAVATTKGIVGYVSEVGTTWCRVSTLVESATSVGAYIPRSGAVGIVSGDFSLGKEGYCKFSYVQSDADVKVGDRIYSTGTGSVYPADLPVGEVIAVEIDEYSRTLVATVKPFVALKDLQYMMIITGYTATPAEQEVPVA